MNIHSKKYRAAANGQPCVRCGAKGTVALRHYEGIRQHAYGKGGGIKGHDIAAADLCHECDDILSNQKEHKSVEKSEEFLHCCMLTIINRIRQGVVKL